MIPFEIIQVITAFMGSLGFALLYNIRGKKLAFAALGGLVSWALFLLLKPIFESETIRYFIVSLFTSIYSEIMARVLKTPTTTFIIISLIPLIPGGSLYYTMANAFEGNVERFVTNGLVTLKLAIALALGVVIVTAFSSLIAGVTAGKSIPKKSKNI